MVVPLWVVPLRHRQEVFENTPEKGTTMKNVDGPAVRLVDETGERLTELLPDVLAIELGQIAALCREGLMALSVEAGWPPLGRSWPRRPTRCAGRGTREIPSAAMCGAVRHRRRW